MQLITYATSKPGLWVCVYGQFMLMYVKLRCSALFNNEDWCERIFRELMRVNVALGERYKDKRGARIASKEMVLPRGLFIDDAHGGMRLFVDYLQDIDIESGHLDPNAFNGMMFGQVVDGQPIDVNVNPIKTFMQSDHFYANHQSFYQEFLAEQGGC